ncbi:hypothetical protein BS628_24985 [Agrobacterium radiobacter]|nr:hypothetical protein BS628_24985 [Agrobacterium radiobacter]
MSQESSRRASARREDSFQPKDLGWLDPCDKHRDEGGGAGVRLSLRRAFRSNRAHPSTEFNSVSSPHAIASESRFLQRGGA